MSIQSDPFVYINDQIEAARKALEEKPEQYSLALSNIDDKIQAMMKNGRYKGHFDLLGNFKQVVNNLQKNVSVKQEEINRLTKLFNDIKVQIVPSTFTVKKHLEGLSLNLLQKIGSYVDNPVPLEQTSKTWKVAVKIRWEQLEKEARQIAFDKKQWEAYFGAIGEEPPIPKRLLKAFQESCPFSPGKKVSETHMLVLIPQTVNDKPLTLKSLGELVKSPKQGHKTGYKILKDWIAEEHGDKLERSQWVLMTKTVLPGTVNMMKYTMQQACVSKHLGYVVPKVIEAAVCIFMHHVSSGTRLYGVNQNPAFLNFTCCQKGLKGAVEVVVGGFTSAGLEVKGNQRKYGMLGDLVGAGGLRK